MLLSPRLANMTAVMMVRLTQTGGGMTVDGDAVRAIWIRIASVPKRPHCSRRCMSLNTPLLLPFVSFVSPCNGKELNCVKLQRLADYNLISCRCGSTSNSSSGKFVVLIFFFFFSTNKQRPKQPKLTWYHM